jgi:hypothetical protein
MLALLAMLPLAGSPSDLPRFDGAQLHRVQGHTIGGNGGLGGNVPIIINGGTVILSPSGGAGGTGGTAVGRTTPASLEGRNNYPAALPTRAIPRCTLKMGGRTLLDGGCGFAASDEQVQFRASSGRSNYFVVVVRTTHEGWVNSQSVGILAPDHACWANAGAQICGWK